MGGPPEQPTIRNLGYFALGWVSWPRSLLAGVRLSSFLSHKMRLHFLTAPRLYLHRDVGNLKIRNHALVNGCEGYDGYGDHAYRERPYYGYDSYLSYGPPSGTFGYRGKDARHHRRGHQHHHKR